MHRLIAARVIKAVIKEKYNDLAFKLANQDEEPRLAIRRIRLADGKHWRLEFQLKPKYGLNDVRSDQEIEL